MSDVAPPQARPQSLVVAPGSSFDEVLEWLEELGWSLESSGVTPSTDGTEPVTALFRHADHRAVVHYSANPVIDLRIVQVAGPEEDADRARRAIEARVPFVDPPMLNGLLGSSDDDDVVLGLAAAGELGAVDCLGRIRALREHPSERVRKLAAHVDEKLLPPEAELALRALAAEQAARPDRTVFFSHLPGVETRRQVLRWFIHDFRQSNPSIEQALRSAFVDDDPEVRITAVLAASRLAARGVLPELRGVELPTTARDGADPRGPALFTRLAAAAIEQLSTPAGELAILRPGARPPRELLPLVEPVVPTDDVTLLIHALTTPLPAEPPPPARLPPGVEAIDRAFRLARTGVPLSWVPPIAHWIGVGFSRLAVPNPLRQVAPAGFFITTSPIGGALAAWAQSSGGPLGIASADAEEPHECDFAEASRLAAILGERSGASATLPSADERECAVRGPDGRFYPWGSCPIEDGPLRRSPWGLDRVDAAPEWTRDTTASGEHIVSGQARRCVCAFRDVAAAGARGPFRLVIQG